MAFPTKTSIVLASSSPFRKALLSNAGIHFEAESARIVEREVKEQSQEAE